MTTGGLGRRRVLEGLTGLMLAAGLSKRAAASDWRPGRPVGILVPFSAGGPSDILARILSDVMPEFLGQPVYVENVTGLGGKAGVMHFLGQASDGHSLLMGHMGTHGAAPGMIEDLGYDPIADFSPVGLVAGTPVVLVARKGLARDLPDLIALLRREGPNASMGHAGRGSLSHAAALLFCSVVDVSPRLVAFNGTGPALNELIAGRLDAMLDQIVNVLAPIAQEQVDGYAIASDRRSQNLPDVPTAGEAGLDLGINAWNALFATPDTPMEQIRTLNLALNYALEDDRTKARLLDLGAELPPPAQRTPDALRTLVNREVARWSIPLGLRGAL